MTKFTKAQKYNAIINFIEGGEASVTMGEDVYVLDPNDLVEFCRGEIESLAKKTAKAKESAAKKRAESADELEDAVLAALTDEFATLTEVVGLINIPGVTSNKIVYRLNALVKKGQAIKDEISVNGEDGKKRKAMAYKLA